MPISFIHCSDIHLGKTQYSLPERFDDFRKSFEHIAEYAIDKEVDFILIAGDLFNKRSINAATLMQATSVLGKFKEADIPVIAIEGNHDKAFRSERMSWMHYLQENDFIVLLKPQFESGNMRLPEWNPETKTGAYIDLGQIRIYGLGYFGAYGGHYLKQLSKIMPDDRDHFAILMFHSGWSKPRGVMFGRVKIGELKSVRNKFDYMAMGHWHSRAEYDNWAYIPGAPEYYSLIEPGDKKGFYHVTVDGQDKSVKFLPTKHRALFRKIIKVSGCSEPKEVYSSVWEAVDFQKLKDMSRPLVQLTLIGKVNFNVMSIRPEVIQKRLKNECDCLFVEVVNNVNLITKTSRGKDGYITRSDIERQVLNELVNESVEFREQAQEMIELTMTVKSMALSRMKDSKIVDFILNSVDKFY